MKTHSSLFICILLISSSILQAQTFPGSAGALTDNNCSGAFNTFSATVSNVGATDVIQSLTINISHSWDGDLNIFLVGPTGTIIELSTGNGGSGVNYVNTIFTDSAPSFITTGTAPFTGSFKPEGRANTDNQCDPAGTVGTYTFASQFAGTNTNGNWTLKIKDGASGDVGILNSWSVTIAPMQTLQKVGINTVNPQATLDVNGKVKIGDDTAPQAAGMMRYSTLANDFEGFNGSVWKSMTGLTSGGGSGNGLVHPTAGSTFESGTNNPGIIGTDNTFIGVGAGSNITNGDYNTAFGKNTLNNTDDGINNTAFGYNALSENFYSANSAFGSEALELHFAGTGNCAFGSQALKSQNNGSDNCAFGALALKGNIQSDYNSAFGTEALRDNTYGIRNCAFGERAMIDNTTGGFNIAIGAHSFVNSGNNYTQSISIGWTSAITASYQARIGNSNTTSIGGYESWTDLSDSRFKKNIHENVVGIEFIKKLIPVTYQLDVVKLNEFLNIPDSLRDINGESIKTQQIRHGFLAQDVEEAANSLGFDFNGVDKPKNEKDHYGLRYSVFVVPLVKAVQEQQEMIDNLIKDKAMFQTENTGLREDIKQLATELKALREMILNK